jgi:hypothetical protein
MTTCKIENNTARLLGLPPTDSFPAGIRLVPGLNNVPEDYLDELKARAVQPEPKPDGTPRAVRYPGRELLDDYLVPVRIVKPDSVHTGPQITILTNDQAGREEGPPPPHDLSRYEKVEVAVALVKSTKDRTALKAYTKDKRQEVAAAARAKLEE